MPFRNLEFSASSTGGEASFSLKYAGKTLVGRTKAARAVPVHIAGNVAAIHAARPGRPARVAWASSLMAAWVLDVKADGVPALARMSGARFRAAPAYPALLESRKGFCAFAAQDRGGETIVVAAGSPAAALSLDPSVSAALPDAVRDSFLADMVRFRVAMAEGMLSGCEPSRGAEAALAILRDGDWRCIAGRGETDDAFVWTFADGVGRHAVAGVSRGAATLTILFPFLAPGEKGPASWRDDGLDYYVKGELEIRPATVTAQTKAVVKTSAAGGFAVIVGP